MLLDIIVPHYKESWDIVKPFVDMIHNQKGIDFNDFRVLMIHDSVDPFPDELLEGPAHFVQVCQDKKGVSAARNFGIEMSEAEWICFCDCDDCYSSIFAFYLIFPILREDIKYDLFWSPFYMISGNMLRVFLEYQPVFIHNKYYRRSFLNEADIRFCEKLYMSEDSAFNSIVEKRIGQGKVGKIQVQEPLYSWCRRPGSITTDPTRYVKNMEGHFDRNIYVLEECKKKPEWRSDLMMVRTLTDVYAQTNIPGKMGDPSQLLKRAAEFFRTYKETVLDVSDENLERLMNVSDLEAGATDAVRAGRPGFRDWLHELDAKY